MQYTVLLVLFLYGVHGAEDQTTPDLLSMVKTLQSKVQTLETALAEQKSEVRVAFFVTTDTTGNYGPFNETTKIKYNYIFTNIGSGYNPDTGVFTAPVKGLYVLHFTVYPSMIGTPRCMVGLKKNSSYLAWVVKLFATDPNDSATRVAVVTLEQGDRVFVELSVNSYFSTDHGRLNSFSGFLLSTM